MEMSRERERERERSLSADQMVTETVFSPKRLRRFPGFSAWSVNVHIACGCMCVTCWWDGWGANAKRTSGPVMGVINLPPGHKSLDAFLLCLPPSSALSLQRKKRRRGALPDNRRRKQQFCWRMRNTTIWLSFRQHCRPPADNQTSEESVIVSYRNLKWSALLKGTMKGSSTFWHKHRSNHKAT